MFWRKKSVWANDLGDFKLKLPDTLQSSAKSLMAVYRAKC